MPAELRTHLLSSSAIFSTAATETKRSGDQKVTIRAGFPAAARRRWPCRDRCATRQCQRACRNLEICGIERGFRAFGIEVTEPGKFHTGVPDPTLLPPRWRRSLRSMSSADGPELQGNREVRHGRRMFSDAPRGDQSPSWGAVRNFDRCTPAVGWTAARSITPERRSGTAAATRSWATGPAPLSEQNGGRDRPPLPWGGTSYSCERNSPQKRSSHLM